MSVHDPELREPAGDDGHHRPPTNLAPTGPLWLDVGATSDRVTGAVGEIRLGADTSQFVSAKPVDDGGPLRPGLTTPVASTSSPEMPGTGVGRYDMNGVYQPVRSPCCGSTKTEAREGNTLTCLSCGRAFEHPFPEFYAALRAQGGGQLAPNVFIVREGQRFTDLGWTDKDGVVEYAGAGLEVAGAARWWKNGDHPEDRVGEECPDPAGGTYVRREGAVVRYYRHPKVPGEQVHDVCGRTMHDHGWIDTPEGGHTVCPGDWVITDVQGERYPRKRPLGEVRLKGEDRWIPEPLASRLNKSVLLGEVPEGALLRPVQLAALAKAAVGGDEPVNVEESSGAAARRFAGELERLLVGLSERGFYPAADGPLGTAAVDTALGAVDRLRYERRLLGASRMVLDRVAGSGTVAPSGMEVIRAEAVDMAQRIVDEIGHPVTDEEALGPELRAELARVTAERDERLTLAESSRLAKRVDDLQAERDHIQRIVEQCAAEHDRECAKAAAYLLWRDATAVALENLINAIEGHITDERVVRPIDLVAEAGRAREVLKVDAEEAYCKDIPPPVKPAGGGLVYEGEPGSDQVPLRPSVVHGPMTVKAEPPVDQLKNEPIVSRQRDELAELRERAGRYEKRLREFAEFLAQYPGTELVLSDEETTSTEVAKRVLLRQREELIKLRDAAPPVVGEDYEGLREQVDRLGKFLLDNHPEEIRGDVDDTTAAGVAIRVMQRLREVVDMRVESKADAERQVDRLADFLIDMTPGEVNGRLAADVAIELIRKLVNGMSGEAVGKFDPLAGLRRQSDKFREQRDQAERDLARIRADHQRACEQLAAMYAAGTGRVGMPAVRGVVEDLADEHQRRLAAEDALSLSFRTAEKLEAELAVAHAALQQRGKPGDRVKDGGVMGTLVRCEMCGGGGLLHRPDELPETAAPQPEPGEPVVAGSKPLLRVADLSKISDETVRLLGWRRVLADVLAEHPAVSERAADVVAFIAPLIVRLMEEQGRVAQQVGRKAAARDIQEATSTYYIDGTGRHLVDECVKAALGEHPMVKVTPPPASHGPMTASFTGAVSGPVRLLDGVTGETLADVPTDGRVVPVPAVPGRNVTFLGGFFDGQLRRVPLVSGNLPRGLVCQDADGGRYGLIYLSDEEDSLMPVYVEAEYAKWNRVELGYVPDPVLASRNARDWDAANPGCGINPRWSSVPVERFHQRLEFTLRANG